MNKSGLLGVRVADFTWVLAGPYCTMLLASLGAEVIKIESSRWLDQLRMERKRGYMEHYPVNQSPAFNYINVNKSSITLDMTHPKAFEVVKSIIKISDIVVQNFRPGVMDRLGLGYPALREVKPDIIMLSCSACGAFGPERENAGYASIFSALGGLSHVTGYPDCPPAEIRNIIDTVIGTAAAFAILAALEYRQRTGEGQHIDLSSREVIHSLIGDVLMDYTMNRRIQSRRGNHDTIMAPHSCYRCQGDDKWVSIAIANDEEWRAFCHAIGHSEWSSDERFSDALSRWKNQEELDKLIEQWTITHTDYEVMDILQKAGVAAIPSFSNKEICEDAHLKARSFTVRVKHPEAGELIVVNPPWKLSSTPARITRAAPKLGEHNDYVFGELLGMTAEEIDNLEKEGILT